MAQATAKPDQRNPGELTKKLLTYAVLILLTLIFIAPLLWMLSTSLKPNAETTTLPLSWIPKQFSTEGYSTILNSGSQSPALRWFLNSMIAGLTHTALILITASMAAYALARMEFRGKRVLFAMIISTLFIPPIILLTPNYQIVDQFGWLDTLLAVIVPGAAGAFGVFFLRQFFLALPPGLSILQGAYTTNYAVIMAGGVIASIPVLVVFILSQRYIIQGVARSGLKG